MITKRLQRLIDNKVTSEIYRKGILFNSDLSNYLYDTGTGKVVKLDDEEYMLFYNLLSRTKTVKEFEDIIKEIDTAMLTNMMQFIINENLLEAKPVNDLYLFNSSVSLEDKISHHTKQLVLEVTEKCNFRCKYCIYNEDYLENRNFSENDMDINIAKKSIDYILKNSDDYVAVTFYGGEPLLRFEFIKECILYTLENKRDKDVYFNLTTNLSLVTEEIADFFAEVPKLSILGSLDGPPNIHNAARVQKGGLHTFDKTIRGLKILCEKFKGTGNILGINAVLIPPYSYKKIQEINTFFESLDWLSNDTEIRIGYPELGSYGENTKWIEDNPIYYLGDYLNPLLKWQIEQVKKYGLDASNKKNIYFKAIMELLVDIDGRRQKNQPDSFYGCNGCCIPGARKIYVKTNGDILLCERIGESPNIGNIQTGIDISKIRKNYVEDYVSISLEDCSKCWAVHLCDNCYAACYNKNGFDINKKRISS